MANVPCLGCGTPHPRGKTCPRCGRGNEQARRQAKNRTQGNQRAHWRKLRDVVLEKRPLCELRYPGCTESATTVHLAPYMEGKHDLATEADCIATACRRCHGRVDGGRA